MRKFLSMVAIASSFAFAQGQPAGPAAARDAGVAATAPARKKMTQVPDAGIAPPVAPSASSMEVERLRKEVAELRARTAELERQQQQTKSDSVNGKLDALTKQLEDFKRQFSQLNETQARREEAEQAQLSQKSATSAASSNLNAVLGALSTGNTSGVEPSLRYAESVYTGNAQKNVQLARQALSQGDVNLARQYLMLAISEAAAQR